MLRGDKTQHLSVMTAPALVEFEGDKPSKGDSLPAITTDEYAVCIGNREWMIKNGLEGWFFLVSLV